MIDWREEHDGLYVGMNSSGKLVARVYYVRTTGRWCAETAACDYLGSSSTPEGAKEIAAKQLGETNEPATPAAKEATEMASRRQPQAEPEAAAKPKRTRARTVFDEARAVHLKLKKHEAALKKAEARAQQHADAISQIEEGMTDQVRALIDALDREAQAEQLEHAMGEGEEAGA